MSYPQQQPYQGGGYNYPQPVSSGNPASAIIAGVLALGLAALLVVAAVNITDNLNGASLSDLPDDYKSAITIILVTLYASGAIALIGAILTMVRVVAGAFILLFAAIAAIASILLQPVILGGAVGRTVPFGDFISEMFKFQDTLSVCDALSLIVAPLVLILALIPPTLNWLRGKNAAPAYGGYPPQQQGYQGW